MSEHFDSHNAAAAFDHDSTLVVALELSGKPWEVGAVVPGIARRPRRRFDPRDVSGLLGSLERRKSEAGAAGRRVSRMVLTRSEEQTSELQTLMRIPEAIFCLLKKISQQQQ